MERERHIEIKRQTDIEMERQRDREKDRQRDIEMERQTDSGRFKSESTNPILVRRPEPNVIKLLRL